MTNEYGVRHPGRREAAVAVTVAFTVLVIAWLAGRDDGTAERRHDTTSLVGRQRDAVVDIDVSSQVSPAQVRACLTSGFARSIEAVTVLYGEVQKTATGTAPALVLRNAGGELRLCDSFGSDSPSVAPVSLADPEHPVRFVSSGREAWDCDGTRLAGLRISHWFSVAAPVDRVQLRFLVDGTAGPWFSTRARGGLAHLHAWLGDQHDGAAVLLQTRVLDGAGEAVRQSALPTRPQPAMGCKGGSVQIG